MKNLNLKFVIFSFLSWRVALFVFLALAIYYLPLQKDFIGGGIENYLKAPYLWSWVNFDGEHYLSVAYQGYLPLTYFFFPAYPLMIRTIANLFNNSYVLLVMIGLVISNVSILLSLIGIWKLIRLDYKKSIAILATILLFVFPTSFYFGSFYTESFFLVLVVWSFYFARKKNIFLASILGMVASATRVIGVVLFPVLLIEFFLTNKPKRILSKKTIVGIIPLFIIPMGLLSYMYYLGKETGDPLEFFHSVGIYGQQRSSTIILLPQVFYRYIFKILPNIHYNYFPVVFVTWLEFLVALGFGVMAVVSFFRMRLSYALYFLLGYLIPTFSGSFSSLPRYVIVLFPAFILGAEYLNKLNRNLQIIIITLLFICLGVATSLFVRGYWIS